MRRSLESLIRVVILAAIASSQITLLVRAGQMTFAVMSLLAWMGGGVLLLEREESSQDDCLSRLSFHGCLASLGLLAWAMLVLSFSARLYDPLLLFLPVVVLPALGFLAGAGCNSSALASQVVIGSLLPLQVVINRFMPTAELSNLTSQLMAFLLWLLGSPAISEGADVIIGDRVLQIDASCTGVTVMALCVAAALMLVLVLPPPILPGFGRFSSRALVMAALSLFAMCIAFLVNLLRVTLLAFTDPTPGLTGLSEVRGIEFWHEGIGSHLFSLIAIALVCAVYVLFLEFVHRARVTRSRH